eukprot:TRINITY_DN2598_c0_g1_i13.p1 TRINITY_DN2598_c0_g1~~TRINITY_DN2598_c0_g1_i13.p1  ORF type:complete len:359 (+),score=90.95 TRINITY_DN2598_c0_g1_i13:287-1363(+)
MYYGFALEAGSDELHQVYGNRSLVRARRRRFEWALQDAERCIYLKPDWPKGHLRAAVAFEGLKEWTTALEKFQQASKLCHDQAEARTEFGMMNAWESKISKRCSEGVKLCHDKIEYESRPYILTNELGEEVFEEQGDPFIGYRVHYHKNGAAERLWVQWEFYRWSQTSTTITILLFAIPPDELVAREIEATFKAKFLAVKHKRTGKTWFERELFDLVMPDECTWTLEEGGLYISLHKNVAKTIHDTSQSAHYHDRLYWRALFAGQPQLRGHEMDHDFSDLPKSMVDKEKQRQADETKSQREERERVNRLTPAEKKSEDDARQERMMKEIQDKNDEIIRREAIKSGKIDAGLFDPDPFD